MIADSRGWRRDIPLVVLLSVLAALSFGISFGDVTSNQVTYLPKGIQLAQPDFLARDWWLNETVQYHVAFSRLVELLFLTGVPQTLMAVINTGLIAGSLVITYLIVVLLRVGASSFFVWSFVVAVFFLGSSTFAASLTYFFSAGLQPSTIATFCFLAGMLCFLRGNDGLSGLVLGLGGAFHLNYAIIGLACFGLAQASLGGRGLFRRMALQQSCMLLVLLANLPLILTLDAGATAAEKQFAADIFFRIAEPFHYDPRSYLLMFLPFAAWHGLALADLVRLQPGPARTRLRALYLAMLIIIAVALALTTVTFVPLIARAFFFRLNPFALLIACTVVGAAAARRIEAPAAESPSGLLSKRDIVADMLRLSAVVIICAFAWNVRIGGRLQSAMVVLPVLCAALLWMRPLVRTVWFGRALAFVRNRQMLAGAGLILLAAAVSVDAKHFGMLTGPTQPAAVRTAGLYRWVTTTPADSLFLTPTDMVDFRLATGRAIVVDDKAVPQGARAVLEWYRRMGDVAGRPGWRTIAEASAGYRLMDSARIDMLAQKYHLDYAVIGNTAANKNIGGEIVYSDPWFLVLRCPLSRDGRQE